MSYDSPRCNFQSSKMSYDGPRCNFQSIRNDKKYIHLDFDDTMTCKKFKDFSSIFPSYGCLYTTIKFV